jgi:hypothetical protein
VRVSQLISIVGAALVLGAFAALQFRRTHAYSRPYLAANVLGSAFLAAAAVLEGLWAFVTLNSVWALVSLRGLFRTGATPGGLAAADPDQRPGEVGSTDRPAEG